MTSTHDLNCTILLSPSVPSEKSSTRLLSTDEILKHLEHPKVEMKIMALKSAIIALCNGETIPRLLMTIIRYCSTQSNHQIKKLLFIYYEIVPKYMPLPTSSSGGASASGASGTSGPKHRTSSVAEENRLLPEMILVCNALLNDLQSPNEYVRGCVLRFLCKIKEKELLEPLKEAIRCNLTHKHCYVRRYAILCVFHIYKHFQDTLLDDLPNTIITLLPNETDNIVRRNGFLFLFECKEQLALQYILHTNLHICLNFGDGFLLLILELIRKICFNNPMEKFRFINLLEQLLSHHSNAIVYEATWTLITLSNSPTAVRACIYSYTKLLNKESDNNIKLLILEKLKDIKKHHKKILSECIISLLKYLNSPNIMICEKLLVLISDLITPMNIDEVVNILKKELIQTMQQTSQLMDKNKSYRHLLIKTIHACVMQFPYMASQIIYLLLEYLNTDIAMEIIVFIRAICTLLKNETREEKDKKNNKKEKENSKNQQLIDEIINKILINFFDINLSKIYRVALWILCEYIDVSAISSVKKITGEDGEEIETMDNSYPVDDLFKTVQSALGELPFVPPIFKANDEEEGSCKKNGNMLPNKGLSGKSSKYNYKSKSSSSFCGGQGGGGNGHTVMTSSAGPMSNSPTTSPLSSSNLVTKSVVLSDGTYATKTITSYTDTPGSAGVMGLREGDEDSPLIVPNLRKLLLYGDFYLACAIASNLTKLLLRLIEVHGSDHPQVKKYLIVTLQYICSFMIYGDSLPVTQKNTLDEHSKQRMNVCVKLLLQTDVYQPFCHQFIDDCYVAYENVLLREEVKSVKREKEEKGRKKGFFLLSTEAPAKTGVASETEEEDYDPAEEEEEDDYSSDEEDDEEEEDEDYTTVEIDDVLHFRQLRDKKTLGSTDIDIDDGADITRALYSTSEYAKARGQTNEGESLDQVYQLTGLSDPIYAEASVAVHDYDIVLDLTITNRTNTLLSDLSIELYTMGDMKLIERPSTCHLTAWGTKVLHATIKVSSTETGHIFGTIVYDQIGGGGSMVNANGGGNGGGIEKYYINLNNIVLDIMDYIIPAECTDIEFRNMWAEFEWENKVAVNTEYREILPFIEYIIEKLKMKCMTALPEEEIDYIAINLYAKSIFGEDALVNLSIEKQENGRIGGYIRIRSKTQGIALSLGDRITTVQRGNLN